MNITSTIITFRIDIDFEGSDVDMVLNEMRARGVRSPVPHILCDNSIKINKKRLSKTPTKSSVNFALNWLHGYVDKKRMTIISGRSCKWQLKEDELTELEKIGINVIETYGLLQGCCHLICECDISIFNLELVEKAKEITRQIFKKFVKYYKIKINDNKIELI